ncbi:amidohydrolase family protein [Cohnella sp. LGH]|uniref:amidohydrolase family protein n=1 Tax=Cohnella sp. LGH TaxID=1619153 RepID=UPI001AD9CF59|nr:amidohydrolase family protein [Cohnella sp. LGH]QTH45303.1 amidohydrolase family protein [Cohnella sp. LGH]
MRVDSHQHYWSIARTDYGWLTPDTGILYRDYLPEHLHGHLRKHGFERTVLVQAAPSVEETYYMLRLGEQDPTIAAVVGWLDFESDSADFGLKLEELRRHTLFAGIRPMIQDLPADWMQREQVVANFRMVAETGVPVDFQLQPWLLDSCNKLMEQVPHLRAVIDHIAKPRMDGMGKSEWVRGLERLASYPGIMCKLSGMVEGSEKEVWSKSQVAPFAYEAIRLFGPNRLMFGSDWPVCLLAADYDDVVELAESMLPQNWNDQEKAAFWGGNAAAFYQIE